MLHVEMASTGEVACFGEDLEEAYLKAIIATGGHVPGKGIFISLGGGGKKQGFLESALLLATIGPPPFAPERTRLFLGAHRTEATDIHNADEEPVPNSR